MRFKNTTGSVLVINDLSVTLGPGEVLDWPDWSVAFGPIPGCDQLPGDDPEPAAAKTETPPPAADPVPASPAAAGPDTPAGT